MNCVMLNYTDITKHNYFLNLNDYGNNGEIRFKEIEMFTCLFITKYIARRNL